MNILRCYAQFNREVEYCQGMNCIAGLMFLIYRDEAAAFNMMTTLIENFKLSDLFKQDVPMLRMYFYQMNRLMAVYLPRLHAHLFEEGINATYFCSPWFLTAFTYILQFCQTPSIPPLLCLIFDGFLIVYHM
ncbi:MAG: TBC domain-containing protein [Candidatus Pacebacteria bacterium]|nr:TBC domain-containing protein [Candidatus Paceibacterota bacterium]